MTQVRNHHGRLQFVTSGRGVNIKYGRNGNDNTHCEMEVTCIVLAPSWLSSLMLCVVSVYEVCKHDRPVLLRRTPATQCVQWLGCRSLPAVSETVLAVTVNARSVVMEEPSRTVDFRDRTTSPAGILERHGLLEPVPLRKGQGRLY